MKYTDIQEKDFPNIFVSNLLDTNRGYNYYVEWTNVSGYEKYNIEFHAMDAMIRCKDIHTTFVKLVKRIPTVIETFPILFGLAKEDRKKVMNGKGLLKIIGSEIDSDDFQQYNFNMHDNRESLDDEQIEEYYKFFVQMGLKDLYETKIEKSTLDYVIGVLVGMDSNGRKNRGGEAFELACEPIIDAICEKYDLKMIKQKKFEVLRKEGYTISDDIAKRKADFIILGNKKSLNIEVNFYNGAGSKPEEIIDSYITRQSDLQRDNIGFILITDGACWNKEDKAQLRKGFKHLDYLLNFKFAKQGLLEDAIKSIFDL